MVVAMKPKTDRFRFNTNGSEKAAIKIEIGMMNAIIGYCFKKSVLINRRALSNLRKLINTIDETVYQTDDRLYARLEFIRTALEGRVDKGIESEELLIEYCKSDVGETYNTEIINKIPHYVKLSYDDIKYINNWVSDKLNYIWLLPIKDEFYDVISRMEGGNYKSYKQITEELLDICKRAIQISREASSLEEMESIGLSDENFLDKVESIVESLRNPNATLKTGIKALNDMLIGGYQSSRLYIYCGLPGGYKSFMLLKSALDIKKYNKTLPKKLGARKTVLFVTMENTVAESVARMFNMSVTAEPLKNFTPKQVIDLIKKNGLFTLHGDDDTDIVIKYFAVNSIDTDDLYTLIEELQDENREVIALVLDYIKRIRSVQRAKDEKEQLKNVTNELKALAIYYDIPVISAHQLNRDSASTIDKAAEANKEDLGRLMGRSNVGSAWEVVENCDWMSLINIEKKRGTENYYLTLKRVKCRYGDNEMNYFNHPFAVDNRIQLIDDYELEESLSEISLASEFDGIDLGRKGKKNAIEREVYENSPFNDTFDFNSSINKKAS